MCVLEQEVRDAALDGRHLIPFGANLQQWRHDEIPLSLIEPLEPADLANTEARRIRDRDFRLIENNTAVDRVERTQRWTIEIHLGDYIRFSHGNMHGCGNA